MSARDQFEISPEGITHKPTRATFSPYPGEPGWGQLDPGQLGNVLPNGDDYEPQEMDAMMQQLWAEYVAAHPDLFKADDQKPLPGFPRNRIRLT
jgi:hypothetical protein